MAMVMAIVTADHGGAGMHAGDCPAGGGGVCSEGGTVADWPVAIREVASADMAPPNSAFEERLRRFNFTTDHDVQIDVQIEQQWVEEGLSCVVWPAAVELAHHLARSDLHGKSILELGCGCALPAIVASFRAPKLVLATDRETALGCTRRNLEMNDVEAGLTAVALDWTNATHLEQVYSRGPWDFVIGADLVYAEEVFAPLVTVLERLVGDNTTLLLSGKRRYAKRWRRFKRLLSQFSGSDLLSQREHIGASAQAKQPGKSQSASHRTDSYLFELRKVDST
jgi:predicted nicotinamide N-methyase